MKKTTFFIALLLILCFTVQASAKKDIYDKIEHLQDSLTVWSRHAPALPANEDSLDFSEKFPTSEQKFDFNGGYLRITLPKYQGMLTTILDYVPLKPAGNKIAFRWQVPVSIRTVVVDGDTLDQLFVDNTRISSEKSVKIDSVMQDHVAQRVATFRTLALPPNYQAPNNVKAPTLVRLRGKHVSEYIFDAKSWHSVLVNFAQSLDVYAGMMSAESKQDSLITHYYILLTANDETEHHFLTCQERGVRKNDSIDIESTIVTFTPFIRIDNLKDLFAKPKIDPNTGRQKWQVKVGGND